jgi:hypothetical protein
MNNGKFDGGQLTDKKSRLEILKRLLNFSVSSSALMGEFQEIQTVNRQLRALTPVWLHAGQTLKTNCDH